MNSRQEVKTNTEIFTQMMRKRKENEIVKTAAAAAGSQCASINKQASQEYHNRAALQARNNILELVFALFDSIKQTDSNGL